jgi:proteic killer suppression protein
MRFKFKDKNLYLLYTEEKNAHRYPAKVVDAFFDVMAIITSAENENDIRAFKQLHFEKLKGNRKDRISLRLKEQFRLIIEIDRDENGKIIWILEIVDYH